MKNVIKNLVILSAIIFAFASCNSDDSSNNTGTVKVQLTDAVFPFNFVTEANVAVAKVELKTENGEFTTVFEASENGSATYNMVTLTNGTTAQVESTSLENGTYTEARVTLSDANIHLSNNTNYNANIDANTQTTVTINPPLVVEIGQDSNILFDLDLQNSFSFLGNGNLPWMNWINSITDITGCSFTPHFRVCDLDQTGAIGGAVSVSGANIENADVSIQVDGATVHTHLEADGSFKFIGVRNGTYAVSVETENNGSTTENNIVVSNNATTTCSLVIN